MKKNIKLYGLKALKWAIAFFVVSFVALFIYSLGSYKASSDMNTMISNMETMNPNAYTYYEDFDQITYSVEQPIKNIIIVPGGKVEADAYKFMASTLAGNGFDVTIYKAPFNLAILAPNHLRKFIQPDLDNVVVGHSLGGVVAAMFAAKHDEVSTVVLLGSYATTDITNKTVYMFTAENDKILNQDRFDANKVNVPADTPIYNVAGGNHSGFGWYGQQKGDGTALITTFQQQLEVTLKIINYIHPTTTN